MLGGLSSKKEGAKGIAQESTEMDSNDTTAA